MSKTGVALQGMPKDQTCLLSRDPHRHVWHRASVGRKRLLRTMRAPEKYLHMVRRISARIRLTIREPQTVSSGGGFSFGRRVH